MSKQPYLADDYAPPHDKDVERGIDEWLEAKEAQRSAADATKLKHATLLVLLQNAGIEAYPYTDPKTGKKKLLVVAREPKAKVTKPHKRSRKESDVEIGEEVTPAEKKLAKAEKKARDEADRVESRRVPRTAAHDTVADPFAATREKLH